MVETKANRDWLRWLMTGSIFLVMLCVIALLYPGKMGSSHYHYEEGKPWKYGDLCADDDFYVMKAEQQLQQEQDSALADFAPFFLLNEKMAAKQTKLICDSARPLLSVRELSVLREQLKRIYGVGLASAADLQQIQSEGYMNLRVVAHHAARSQKDSISSVYTPKSAYISITQALPNVSPTVLADFRLNLLLLPNLTYDSVMTNTVKQQILMSLPGHVGKVVKGQKIVDRGEIVTPEIYLQLRSMERAIEEKGADHRRAIWSFVAVIVLFTLFLVLMILYLHVFRQQLFRNYRTLLFFTILMTIVIALACLVVRFTSLSLYIVPFLWVPVIVRVFYDSRTALYLHMVVTLICSFLAPVPFEFIVLQMAAGMVAVSSLKDMAQRSQLLQTALWSVLVYALGYTAFILAAKGDPTYLHWHIYIYFLANGALLGLVSYGLIYVFEKTFGLVSSITLVELTNINSALLVEFAEKAPGSFQHSLQVSNLAVEAAKRVGANPLLVRTGALYHDIGKMETPQNFTENQSDGHNPLLEMTCENAAQAVIAHVENGVAIAERHHLPEMVTKFISQHHGTSKVRYFYNSYVNAHPGEEVNEVLFTYPGPRPTTKEVAILMMADAVEARSRSLSTYTEDSIRQMVDQMINLQMADQQFEDTPLTFRDIHAIKEVFTKKLISMNHHRIVYPELIFQNTEEKK